MNSKTLLIFTRTPLHIGAGSSIGAIDQPIQRERHTSFPIIPGSSLKGVFRNVAATIANLSQEKIDDMFGPENAAQNARAGDLSLSEAKILAFPVRSAKGSFAYVTCPLALQRFAREKNLTLSTLPDINEQTCLAGNKVTLDSSKVVLEEYTFTKNAAFPEDWENILKPLIQDPVWQEVSGRLILINDGDFSHFVSTTTEITTQVKIDVQTGAAAKGALFNIECVPAETLFFSNIQDTKRYQATDALEEISELISKHPIMQFGGDSSTGRGFCSVALA